MVPLSRPSIVMFVYTGYTFLAISETFTYEYKKIIRSCYFTTQNHVFYPKMKVTIIIFKI